MAVDEPTIRRRKRLKIAGLLLLAAFLVAAGAAVYLYYSIHQVYGGFRGEVFLQIETGTTSRQMASRLAARGVVRKPWVFLAVRALRPRAILQAGEYRFHEPASAWDVFERLVRGDVYYYTITVPEGANIFDTAGIVAGLDWIDEEEVLRLARNPAMIRDLAPAAESLEGYLFPSTYHVTRGTTARRICLMMIHQFRLVWNALGTGADVHETVTLASLVEKETGVAGERRLVASVFRNRLKRGMKLECDPTVIYAAMLEDRWDDIIHRSDLANPHRYNTYQHPGLPPGPIANPGRAALEAALHPADTKYLFFVAKPDGSGGHIFSETVGAHNRAVARYRRGLDEAKRQKRTRKLSARTTDGENN